ARAPRGGCGTSCCRRSSRPAPRCSTPTSRPGWGPADPTEGDAEMPTYILLSTLTQQGVQTLKSNPERLRQVNQDVEELGAKIVAQWATLGEFDFVNVVEAPDLATIAKVSVGLAARGSIRIETLPALPIEEFLATLE